MLSFFLQVLCFIIFVVMGHQSHAAFSNYHSILLGDQAAGMGGAYAALWGDPGASPFYNPAGLAWLKGTSFSASAAVYKKFDTVIGQEEDFTKAPLRINQGFFESVPTSTGSVIKLEDYMLALSIIVPDYETYNGKINSSDTNTSVLNFHDESLWVGGSIASRWNKNYSWGMTAYYTARTYTRNVQDRTFTSTTDARLYSEEKGLKSNAIVLQFGAQAKLNREWSVGLLARLPSLQIAGQGTFFSSDAVISAAATPPVSVTATEEKDIAAYTRIPAKLTLGFGWQNKKWKFAADGSIYGAESYKDFGDKAYASSVEHIAMGNGTLGVEYRMFPWMYVRMGWYTNLTSQKELNVTDKYGDRVDMLGYAANIGIFRDDHILFTFGGYYNVGKGSTVQRVDHVYSVVPKQVQVFTMLVGTSYFF